MNIELASTLSTSLPAARVPIRVRAGALDDVEFIDELHKGATRQVGFVPKAQLIGKIKLGQVLVAEVVGRRASDVGSRESDHADPSSPLPTPHSPLFAGYLIGQDQYFKRDDVGVIYAINVVREYRRSLVAANLLQAQFDRSAYGTRLYCCWCAQDIEANRFWEEMGFIPLAYRAGSETRGEKQQPRRHIFWQKRIRAGDVTTPFWYPAKTAGGALRADRIVLPIPPGVDWRDELPALLNGEPEPPREKRPRGPRVKKPTTPVPAKAVRVPVVFGRPGAALPTMGPTMGPTGASQVPTASGPTSVATSPPATTQTLPAVAADVAPKRTKAKADPAVVAKARELRDRYLEQYNANQHRLALSGSGQALNRAKYDVARVVQASPPALEAGEAIEAGPTLLITEASRPAA